MFDELQVPASFKVTCRDRFIVAVAGVPGLIEIKRGSDDTLDFRNSLLGVLSKAQQSKVLEWISGSVEEMRNRSK